MEFGVRLFIKMSDVWAWTKYGNDSGNLCQTHKMEIFFYLSQVLLCKENLYSGATL